MSGQIILNNLDNRGTLRVAINTMFGELYSPGLFFRTTVVIHSSSAGTAVHVVPVANVGATQKVYILGCLASVNGATAWTDPTATILKLQDTSAVVGITYPKAILTGNAVLPIGATGQVLANPILQGTGFTTGAGVDLVTDGNFAAGSDIYATVWGCIQ